MATIRTAFQIQDYVTPIIKSINTALNTCISNFQAVQTASNHAVNTANLAAAKTEIIRTSAAMDSVGQNIREADAAQRQLNSDMRQGQSDADELASKVKNVAAGIVAAVGSRKILGMSDTIAQTTARLDLMNDGMQSTAQLQEMIFASAERSRGAYQTTADVIGKLGMQAKDAFSSTAEIIAFTEQLNKTFIISGTSTVGVESAMLQLTQAMAAGKLQGEELNAILDNAQPIVENIAKYMGVPVGSIKEMASEGMITADIIKNAMFAAADETNARFAKIPKTFDNIWTSIKNHAERAFKPVFKQINDIANSEQLNQFTNSFIGSMYKISNEIQYLMNQSKILFNFLSSNWSFIAPIVYEVAAAYIAYKAAVIGAAVVEGISNIIKLAGALASFARAAALGTEASATAVATAAQWGLNTAILACPVTWIILAITALVAIFYLAIAAMNKWAGTSLSATGIILGAIYVIGAVIANVFIAAYNLVIDVFSTMWNFIATFAEFLMNVFTNPIASIIRLFGAMADVVLGILSGIASAIDTLFGSNLRAAVENCRKIFGILTKEKFGAVKYELPRGNPDALRLNRFNVGQAWEAGKAIGARIGNMGIGNIALPGTELGDNIAANIAETAANTGMMKDSLEITTEDLKYLRDIAEQEVINRFTTAEIKIDMHTDNHISSNMDLDGVTNYLKDSLIEAVQTAAEKVHK